MVKSRSVNNHGSDHHNTDLLEQDRIVLPLPPDRDTNTREPS